MAISGNGRVIRYCKDIYNGIQTIIGRIGNGSNSSVLKNVILGTFSNTDTNKKSITVNHATVDTSKSFVLVDGNGTASSSDAGANKGVYISNRTPTSITFTVAHGESAYFLGSFSYQIIEFY